MNRRRSIKRIAIVAGGLVTLPQWMVSCGISDSPTHQTLFSNAEQEILSAVTDTIIPAGKEAVGALAVGADKYLLKLVDDCLEKEVQDNVKAQLKALDVSANSLHKRTFADCSQPERQALLLKLADSKAKADKDFFTLVKTETIRGFNTSQKVMLEYLGYKVAPGYYHGCVEVKA